MGDMKSRYTLAEAVEYLKRETETPELSVNDLVTLAAEGKLSVCFPYKGQLGLFKSSDPSTDADLAQSVFGPVLKTFYFNGILRSLSRPEPGNEITDLRGHTRKAHTLHPVRVVPVFVFASDPPVEAGEPDGHHWRRVHGARHSWAGRHLMSGIPEAEWMIETESLHALSAPFQSDGARTESAAIQRQQDHLSLPESPRKEIPEQRQDRRLKRLRLLGGQIKRAGTGWHMHPRGVLTKLVNEEKAAGHPMSDRSDVRRDLIAATERVRAGPSVVMVDGSSPHSPFDKILGEHPGS